VELRDVSIDDGHGRPLFRDLSLTIEAGTTVCLLGPSGAGKSTLLGLISRVADPRGGAVLIDGVDLRDATIASVRAQSASVPQDTVLFATSIRENIRLGRLDASDAEIVSAARSALAHEFVMALPDGYDTVVGERGGTLSGGQRQRIAIARAMLRNAPIVVLDEPTTGLDPHSRDQVAESLARLGAGRTTLAVTHDPAMLRGADRVLWLQDGYIVEDGAPAELLADDSTHLSQWMSTALESTRPDARLIGGVR